MASRVPRIDQCDDVVYFVDAEGNRWRVYDASYGPPHAKPYKHAIHPFGSSRATVRVFVPPDPAALRRNYTFKPGDSRELAVDRLTEQLQRCTWSNPKKFDPATSSARSACSGTIRSSSTVDAELTDDRQTER